MSILIVGLVAFFMGVFALSKQTKSLPWALKYAPVMLAAIGAFLSWSYFADRVPVISHASTQLQVIEPGKMVMTVDARRDRNCKLTNISVYMVETSGFKYPAYIVYESSPPRGKDILDFPITVYGSPEADQIETVYIVTEHLCAFDITVKSQFGEVKPPASFTKKL